MYSGGALRRTRNMPRAIGALHGVPPRLLRPRFRLRRVLHTARKICVQSRRIDRRSRLADPQWKGVGVIEGGRAGRSLDDGGSAICTLSSARKLGLGAERAIISSLYSVPGFAGVRSQHKYISSPRRKEWKHRRPTTDALPVLSKQLLYARRLRRTLHGAFTFTSIARGALLGKRRSRQISP